MYYGDSLHLKSGINITRINFLPDNGAIWLHTHMHKNPQKLQFSVLSKIKKKSFSPRIDAKKASCILEGDKTYMKYLKYSFK